jgi:hypothetical protein
MNKFFKTAINNRERLLSDAKANNVPWWHCGVPGRQTTEVISITPQMAADLLNACPSSRPPNQSVVDAMVQDINDGQHMIASGLTLEAGMLQDGYTRLWAMAKAQKDTVASVTFDGGEPAPVPVKKKTRQYRSIDEDWET